MHHRNSGAEFNAPRPSGGAWTLGERVQRESAWVRTPKPAWVGIGVLPSMILHRSTKQGTPAHRRGMRPDAEGITSRPEGVQMARVLLDPITTWAVSSGTIEASCLLCALNLRVSCMLTDNVRRSSFQSRLRHPPVLDQDGRFAMVQPV